MKKLKLAIIGQGRSGKDIHGKFYISEANTLFDVRCVVDEDEHRRDVSAARYPGAEILSDYRDLFGKNIDVVVNATYSCEHYAITRDLIEHGFNVLVEKPFARTRYECESLIRLAKERGVVLAVFQQTFYAPFYRDILKVISEKKVGDALQVSIRPATPTIRDRIPSAWRSAYWNSTRARASRFRASRTHPFPAEIPTITARRSSRLPGGRSWTWRSTTPTRIPRIR